MAELPRLRVGLTLDSQTFVRETNRVIDSVNKMNQRVSAQNDRMQRSFNQVTGSLNTLRAAFAAFGVGAALRNLVQTQTAFERINNTLRAGTGSAQAAARGFDFVRTEAQRLGLDLATSATQFAKLSAAARGTALEGQRSRDIFTAVAEASTVLGLSAEQTSGALTAIEQIISKGTVSAEELRGQLGERLPGAFQIAARSIGVTTQELDKMLRAGELTAERLLPALASELRRTFGPEVERAAQGLQATLNRLNTSWFNFRLAVAQGGVTDALADFAKGLTEASEGGDAFAQQLGADLGVAIRGVGDLALTLARNIREVGAAIAAFLAYKAAAWFFELAGAIRAAGVAMLGFNTAFRANPIGLIATGVGLAVGLLYEFRDATVQVGGEQVRVGDLVVRIWNQISDALQPVIAGLNKIGELVGAVLDAVGINVAQAGQPFDVLASKLAVVQDRLTQMREMSASLVAAGVTPATEITQEIVRLESEQASLIEQLEATQLAQQKVSQTTDEAADAYTAFGDASNSLTKEQERLAKQLADTLADLRAEADGAKLLAQAQKEGVGAVRAAEALIEAENITRRLKIGLLTAEGQEIEELIRTIKKYNAEAKLTKDIDEAIARAKKTLADAQADNARKTAKAQQKLAEEQRDLFLEPVRGALQSIQDTFADTFEEIFQGGVTSFRDLAGAIKDIFIRLAAEIAALMVIRPVLAGIGGPLGIAGFGAAAAPSLASQLGPAAAIAGGPGRPPTTAGLPGTAGFAALQPGLLGSTGFLGSNITGGQALLAGGLGAAGGGLLGPLLGLNGPGSTIGGGLGSAAGALLGSIFPGVGTVLGAVGGGLLGGVGGGLLGGLFGGGPSGSKVNIQGGLGAAAAGGTGGAALAVQQFDKAISDLLDTRSQALADQALRRAAGVSVQYSGEPSANDLARLAAGRIGPVAQALGFRRGAITGGGRTPEEQLARLGEAINVKQQVEDLVSGFGAFASQARALKRQFDELRESAQEFGLSVRGMRTEQRAAGFDLIRNQIQQLTGETPTFADRLKTLRAEFLDIKKAAGEFGFSIAEVRAGLRKATESLREQERAVREQERARISQLALSVIAPFEQLLSPLEAFQTQLKFADLNPLKQFEAAQKDFERIANLARAGSTIAIEQLPGAGELLLRLAEQVGASPLAASVRQDVSSVIESVMADVRRAQTEASRGLETEIRRANREQVDTLKELLAEMRDVKAEIRRSRG